MIGQECKYSNVFSGLILIGRGLDQARESRIEITFETQRKSLFSFEGTTLKQKSGGNYGEATPVPMPNTEVKLSNADDSWLVTTCENM